MDSSDLALAPPDQTPPGSEPAPPPEDAAPAVVPSCGGAADCSCGAGARTAESTAHPGPRPRPTEPAPPAAPAHPVAPAGVRAASGTGDPDGQLIYALGTVGYDFRTEAQRDGFRQQMLEFQEGVNADGVPIVRPPNPYDPRHLNRYLAENPWASDKLTWTLNLDKTPIYALTAETPVGMAWEPFASTDAKKPDLNQVVGDPDQLAAILSGFGAHPPVSYVYKLFRDAIVGQIRDPAEDGFVSRVSIPGVLTGRSVRLFSGQVVPEVSVRARGLYTWNEAALVNAVAEAVEKAAKPADAATPLTREANERNIRAFLDKIYYQFRNLGQSPADRALNYAGTNAFLFGSEIQQGFLSGEYAPGPNSGLYTLDRITVAKSPYCRMDSDCWDVVLTFFDPVDDRRARVSWLFTIDVSWELPVSIAPPHRFLGAM